MSRESKLGVPGLAVTLYLINASREFMSVANLKDYLAAGRACARTLPGDLTGSLHAGVSS